MNYDNFLKKDADELKVLGQWRELKTFESISPSKVIHNNQKYIMMASNNYLGLTHHPFVIKQAKRTVDSY